MTVQMSESYRTYSNDDDDDDDDDDDNDNLSACSLIFSIALSISSLVYFPSVLNSALSHNSDNFLSSSNFASFIALR